MIHQDVTLPKRSGDQERRRSATEREELDERRRALVGSYRFTMIAWPSYFLLDLYVVYVIAPPKATVAWFAAWRILGFAALLAGYLTLLAKRERIKRLGLLELWEFVSMAALIAVMALRYGGLNSRYVHGISLVVLVQAGTMASRWQRGLRHSLATALTYPLVMSAAAPFDPDIARAWRDIGSVALFAFDYIFVLSTAILGSIAGHMVWAAHRQVFQARKLGRYRLKMRIGEGGMGEVWMAFDEALNRDVAVKILTARAGDTLALKRFEREARATTQLHDPHTIRVFDYGASDDGLHYLAMELLSGANLAFLVGSFGAMPPARVIHFARQACSSLSEAHQAGIVHRDIKPENLFVTRIGDEYDFMKVLDFGVVKITNAQQELTLTNTGAMIGTPLYMPPEVFVGGDVGPRSDIYSLGAVMYFLLTGVPPFAPDHPRGLLYAHTREEPVPPSQRGRQPAPPELEALILRCLAKEPAARFASAAELDAALVACPVRPWTNADALPLWRALLPAG
jgi:serine/threonine-protein kinase